MPHGINRRSNRLYITGDSSRSFVMNTGNDADGVRAVGRKVLRNLGGVDRVTPVPGNELGQQP